MDQLFISIYNGIIEEFKNDHKYIIKYYEYDNGTIICKYEHQFICAIQLKNENIYLYMPNKLMDMMDAEHNQPLIYHLATPDCFDLIYLKIRKTAKLYDN